MELTNYSFLQSRNDYMTSIAQRKVTADRIATGKRLERSGADVGSISQSAYQRTEMLSDRQSIINLQNLRSFLFAQENSLRRVYEMYDKMEVLALKAANPITSSQERADLEIEYSAYVDQLDEIMKSRYNGKLLFSTTEMCGGPVDVTLKELDMSTGARKGGASLAIRAQTVETGSPSGQVSFRVNSGVVGDNYRIYMGEHLVFSAGPRSNVTDHTEQYNDNGPRLVSYTKPDGTTVEIETQGISTSLYSGHGWRTSGSAGSQDDDLFTVSFGPGQKTTYTVTPGASNDNGAQAGDRSVAQNLWDGSNWLAPVAGDGISDYNQYDLTTGKYVDQDGLYGSNSDSNASGTTGTGVIITGDLPETFDGTEMTLQVETRSIGVIYEEGASANGDGDGSGTPGVNFVPMPFIREIPKDRHGNDILLKPKGFDRFSENTLDTPLSAQEAVDKMRGNGSYFGEMKCILENRIGILGSEYKRVDSEIRALEDQLTTGELALGRIRDADMAKEATALARESLKSEMAVQVMSNSSRIKDVLIPLTTDHFRGSVLQAGI